MRCGIGCRRAPTFRLPRINAYLMRWVRKKYRRFRARGAFQQAWRRVTTQHPRFFAHWAWATAVPKVW
ncbi:hypothetical protein CQY23_15925 [Mycobacterium celatum]|uniref:Group II intron maturase-specific domain-containing protein n=1 Tax=Mycobacterium celatum TaxID=28045 RepID=A0A2G5PJD2_MYCCE|nr:hypothetical protein CQY23_15925 [Mycobacterium celatum]